ncbi:MAG: protein-glutamate O-methyltransferase CheR [Sandaracinaceae bacterium]
MTVAQLRKVAEILYRESAITLSDSKQQMASTRLRKRLAATGCEGYDEYIRLVESDAAERQTFVDQMTTNETRFHREPAHYGVFAELLKRWRRPVDVWCGAASTGQEPYQLAMTMREALASDSFRRSRVLATDLDRQVLKVCRKGEYPESAVAALPSGMASRHFVRTPEGAFSVAPEVRKVVTFARLNLVRDWPMKGPFDVIFLRNVMIYFDQETRARLVQRLRGMLRTGGVLFISHAETIGSQKKGLKMIRPSAYERVE